MRHATIARFRPAAVLACLSLSAISCIADDVQVIAHRGASAEAPEHTFAAWDLALAREIARHAPDLVVCAGFMRILGRPVLEAFPVVNTHPALLPAFPGAHAVRDALAYGVKVTGVTVHLVDEGVDTGPVVAQAAVAVETGDTEQDLHARIQAVEQPLYVDAVGRLARGGWKVEGRTVVL